MDAYCETHQLGVVLGSTNGIQCFSDESNKVRKPDISFVKRERFTAEHLQEGFLSISPDLAIEIISANERVPELDEKIEEYLAAGIPLVLKQAKNRVFSARLKSAGGDGGSP